MHSCLYTHTHRLASSFFYSVYTKIKRLNKLPLICSMDASGDDGTESEGVSQSNGGILTMASLQAQLPKTF